MRDTMNLSRALQVDLYFCAMALIRGEAGKKRLNVDQNTVETRLQIRRFSLCGKLVIRFQSLLGTDYCEFR